MGATLSAAAELDVGCLKNEITFITIICFSLFFEVKKNRENKMEIKRFKDFLASFLFIFLRFAETTKKLLQLVTHRSSHWLAENID